MFRTSLRKTPKMPAVNSCASPTIASFPRTPQVIRLINSTALPIPLLLSPPLRRHMTEMFPRLCHPRHPMRIPIPPNSWPSRLLVEMLRFSRMQGTLGSTKPSIPTTCRFQTKGTKMGRDWRHICILPHHVKLYVPACIAVPPDL